MFRVVSIIRKPAVKADQVVDTVVLDHVARKQKSLRVHGEGGLTAELAMDKEPNLKDGDALKLEDGTLIVVKAADEKLFKITAENPLRLLRLAWQLGNRHVSVEATAKMEVFIEAQPAIDELIRGQGCSFEEVQRPFNPEQPLHDHDCCHGEHHHHHNHHEHDDHCHCGCGGHHDHSHHHDKHHDDCGCSGHGDHDHHDHHEKHG